MRIKGKRAVVTGASGGIGKAVTLQLARLGADVAVVARREGELRRLAAEVEPLGTRVLVVPCDVADRDAVRAAYDTVLEGLGEPDILVNAAGCGVWKPFLEIEEAQHREMMEVNYWGTFNWTRSVLPLMLGRGKGHIVNIAAGSGKFALPVTSGYSASMFAVTGFSEALHRELLGTRGVRVSCVNPGSVRTGFWSEQNTPRRGLPPIVRYSPKLSPAAVARNVCYCIWFGFPTRTMPIFVGLVAKSNALWVRLGDLILWKWFIPLVASLLLARLLWRIL